MCVKFADLHVFFFFASESVVLFYFFSIEKVSFWTKKLREVRPVITSFVHPSSDLPFPDVEFTILSPEVPSPFIM